MSYTKVCIAGLSACGKTTLLQALKTLMPEFEIVEGSQKLCELAKCNIEELMALSKERLDCLRAQFLDFLQNAGANLIVSGHYSFLMSSGGYDIAMREDARFYDMVFFLDTDCNVIYERLRQRGINLSLESIKAWNAFELHGLQEECKRHNTLFSAIDSQASEVAKFIHFIHNERELVIPSAVFSSFMQEHGHSLKPTIILSDCDGTLDNKDGVKEFYKIPSVADYGIDDVFCGHRFYGAYQFFRLTQKRLEIDEGVFYSACKRAAHSLALAPQLVEVLQTSNASLIAITAGIRAIWQEVFHRYELAFSLVANDRRTIISEDTKAYFARELTRLGFRVIALGDGLVDIGMLEYATKPILIESKKTEFILSRLSKEAQNRLIICQQNRLADSIRAAL